MGPLPYGRSSVQGEWVDERSEGARRTLERAPPVFSSEWLDDKVPKTNRERQKNYPAEDLRSNDEAGGQTYRQQERPQRPLRD